MAERRGAALIRGGGSNAAPGTLRGRSAWHPLPGTLRRFPKYLAPIAAPIAAGTSPATALGLMRDLTTRCKAALNTRTLCPRSRTIPRLALDTSDSEIMRKQPSTFGARRAALVAAAVFAITSMGCQTPHSSAPPDADAAAVDAAYDTAPTATDTDAGPPCTAGRALSGGACCGDGEFALEVAGACGPVGPRGCADLVGSAGPGCGLRWCSAATCEQDDGGTCFDSARLCGAQEEGCPAGEWPVPWDGGKCAPAGSGGSETATTPDWCEVDGVPGPCPKGVSGCPAGQVPGADGCTAAGPTWWCPPGFIEVDGGGEHPDCAPDPDDCLPWEAVPGAIHVLASHEGPSDGSFAKPYRTLAEAVGIAATGATIFVGDGTYEGTYSLLEPLTIRGRCADRVTLVASKTWPILALAPTSAAGVSAVERMRLGSSFAVTAPGVGPRIQGALSVHFDRVLFEGLTAIAVRADGPLAAAELHDCVVTGVGGLTQASHAALAATGGGTIRADHVRITRSMGAALHAAGEGSSIEATSVVIDELDAGMDKAAAGVIAFDGADVALTDVAIVEPQGYGVVANNGSHVQARGLLVDGVRPTSEATLPNVSALAGATIDLVGASIRNPPLVGIGALDGGVVRGTGVLVERTHADLGDVPAVTSSHGSGVIGIFGGRIELQSSRLLGNLSYGVFLTEPGTTFVGRDVVIDHTIRNEALSDSLGLGLDAQSGATIELRGALVTDNDTAGIVVNGSSMSAVGLDVEATHRNPAVGGGCVHAVNGGSIRLAGSRTRGGLGLHAVGWCDVGVIGSVVDAVDPEGGVHAAVYVQGYSSLALRASRVSRGGAANVALFDWSAGLIEESVLEGSLGGKFLDDETERFLGDGVFIDGLSAATVRTTALVDNARAGLFVAPGGEVVVRQSAATRNLYGIVIDSPKTVETSNNALFENALQDWSVVGSLTVPPPPEAIVPTVGSNAP